MISMNLFWMVHGDGPANHRHGSRASAVTEAERLARANPGKVFVVLEAVEAVRKIDVERVELRQPGARTPQWPAAPDDIPF
ncbi:hypothetical protein [Methylobacterium sp. ARG-1]|uniref:hypothetical protein n=1 Tax=Methylobacterium sp. ARG-1 TaxID=1692501 RepID=UPI0006821EAD|nr:hypothetical protein [Methylobacterium sp. ARG-1]KNY20373.1 hypothetical protein AKJ13_22350 [Methylobacterium sp. ARG-1]